jgi:hypothetical protein
MDTKKSNAFSLFLKVISFFFGGLVRKENFSQDELSKIIF